MRRALAAIATIALASALAGCGIGATNVPVATHTPEPLASLSGGLDLTRGTLEAALAARGLTLTRPNTPFRPPEAPQLIDLPRAVFHATLPASPDRGFVVVFELPDPSAAYAAALAQAAWLASGPGAVQFPPGTTHLVRVVGATVVTYSRLPEGSDPAEADLVSALETVGKDVPVATT